jgi:hypothetical protein
LEFIAGVVVVPFGFESSACVSHGSGAACYEPRDVITNGFIDFNCTELVGAVKAQAPM